MNARSKSWLASFVASRGIGGGTAGRAMTEITGDAAVKGVVRRVEPAGAVVDGAGADRG